MSLPEGRCRVYIIGRSIHAFIGITNALLNTGEPPLPWGPPCFSLHQVHRFPIAILSQLPACQFKRISPRRPCLRHTHRRLQLKQSRYWVEDKAFLCGKGGGQFPSKDTKPFGPIIGTPYCRKGGIMTMPWRGLREQSGFPLFSRCSALNGRRDGTKELHMQPGGCRFGAVNWARFVLHLYGIYRKPSF